MTRFLVDTTALIDFSKNREPARTRLLELLASEDEVAACAVNVTEFYAGVRPEERAIWDELFESLSYWEITLDAAKEAGIYRYDFARKGMTILTMDALVAAVARERKAIVITDNVKDYPMTDIDLLSWRARSEA